MCHTSVYETKSLKSSGFGVVRAAQGTWLIMHKSNTLYLGYKKGGHIIVTHALPTYLIPGAAPHFIQSGVHFYTSVSFPVACWLLLYSRHACQFIAL